MTGLAVPACWLFYLQYRPTVGLPTSCGGMLTRRLAAASHMGAYEFHLTVIRYIYWRGARHKTKFERGRRKIA